MEQTDRCKRQVAVLLLVFLAHGLLIDVLMRRSTLALFHSNTSPKTLLLHFLPREAPDVQNSWTAQSPKKFPIIVPGPAPFASIKSPMVVESDTPQPDWQHELERAATDRVADADKEKAYRNLSKSMSPSQLEWLEQHHMEPSDPGLTWKAPRVEVTKDGLPIVHINDHCVLVPLFLMPMIFCSIGHIEADGDLFKHMRDPRPP